MLFIFFLEQQKHALLYKRLSETTLKELIDFFNSPAADKYKKMMKDQIFQEIDDLYPVHHFPKVITNLIMEYKDYEPRLFQHTPEIMYPNTTGCLN